ncbi:MAG: hypothetical protein ACRC8Y_07180 [Chroococcales cyanobacterium]
MNLTTFTPGVSSKVPDVSGGACSIQLSHSPKAKLIVAELGTTRLLFCGGREFYREGAIA